MLKQDELKKVLKMEQAIANAMPVLKPPFNHSHTAACVALLAIEKSVNKLWQSVEDGMHDARSLVGDETLSMAEQLKQVGLGPLKR